MIQREKDILREIDQQLLKALVANDVEAVCRYTDARSALVHTVCAISDSDKE